MKILKTLAVISLSSFLAMNSFAAENKSSQQGTQQQMTDKNLIAFNKAIKIKLIERKIGNDGQQDFAINIFELENTGNKNIKSLHWTAVYTVDGQPFMSQPIRINSEKPLRTKSKEKLTVQIPLGTVNEQARNIFKDTNASIGVMNRAELIQFSNGSKIEVK
ncbi:hypothetical protein A1D22_11095 [Pasteurellaceae bacterium LFhippo2]|nr:hypothetical protein [Pasteurellaceae bacterium LFhippo2]